MIERTYIIDDDEISVFLTSMLLETTGFTQHIETYQHAGAALQKLQKAPDLMLPQVIFLDLNMPAMTGWDFLDVLTLNEERYLNKCLVFILTSSVDAKEKERATKYRLVKGFLRKPLDEEELAHIAPTVNQP